LQPAYVVVNLQGIMTESEILIGRSTNEPHH
jgi:hypothetical protein